MWNAWYGTYMYSYRENSGFVHVCLALKPSGFHRNGDVVDLGLFVFSWMEDFVSLDD